ncbi:hypothetical protein PVIIG_00127 [Plasmodium vivax India VII]|uniref:Uncharacterized protein n=1 Tax=Plasmodium vivax India VII TaxID=1077284 RepID=A0A0J9S9V8_PLAVI|nr:hypothetical protein PVIIG_00127 [Plasmodium vivax India VII]
MSFSFYFFCNFYDSTIFSIFWKIKGKWKTGPFLRILKNYIIYTMFICMLKKYPFVNLLFLENLEMLAYLKIYEKIYEYTIRNIFLENSPDFDSSKEILNFFWFSTNDELKAQSFEISLSHFEKLFLENKHNLGPHTKEYLAQLEKGEPCKKKKKKKKSQILSLHFESKNGAIQCFTQNNCITKLCEITISADAYLRKFVH